MADFRPVTAAVKAYAAACVKEALAAPVTTTPPTTTSTGVQPFPTHPVGLYHMCWSNSGSPLVGTTPANVNVLYLAFAQGDPPSLVGNASDGASFGTELKKLRARGVRIIASVGGQGGAINISNQDAFVNGIAAISTSLCPLDGLDFDLEGPAMGTTDVLAVATKLKSKLGTNFAITMAPNGSNIGTYLPIAKALYSKGLLAGFGQQFYDAPVSTSAMMGRIDEFVGTGIPASKYSVGMMIASDSSHWTNAQCVTNYKAAKAKYPSIGGAYLWEASRPGCAQWATEVGTLVKAG